MPVFLTVEPTDGSERVSHLLTMLSEFCVNYGLKLIGAIAVLILGCWLVRIIMKLINKSRWVKKIDKDIRGFVTSTLKVILYALVLVTIIAIMGVPMASIVAVIASCGVAIGLALQGSLSNLAGGLMLIIFKPFHVGDYISANGYEGTVEEIGIFCTTLRTIDNRRVVLPNAGLSNTTMVNSTHYDTRRVDHIFKTEPDEDSEKVVAVLTEMAEAEKNRLPNMPVEVRFDSFGEGCAKYQVRVWCLTTEYWDLYYALLKDGKLALAQNGIKPPLPKVEVHEAKGE